ncbi:MAG: iron ABC transporter permease [Pseudoflavonifractor sp.]
MTEQNRLARRNILIILTLVAALVCGIVFSFMLGRYPISPKELGGILLSKLCPIDPFWTPKMETILWNVRLPRIVLACMVGACLSAAGCAYQGVFQNPMASPDILGATKGSAFGAALAILLGWGSRGTMVSAFCFGLITIALVWLAGSRAKGKRVISLILAGIIISSLFEAGTSYIKLVADPNDHLPNITYWLMGSLTGAKLEDLGFVLPLMLLGLGLLLLLRWQLGVLTLGDDEAKTMGINAKVIRMAVLLCATFLTATSVSVSGVISWVGLVVPHLARRLVGGNYRYLMPASMVLGALFLLLVDNISRNLFATEIPLGILTAFVGAPFFLYLLTKGGEGA